MISMARYCTTCRLGCVDNLILKRRNLVRSSNYTYLPPKVRSLYYKCTHGHSKSFPTVLTRTRIHTIRIRMGNSVYEGQRYFGDSLNPDKLGFRGSSTAMPDIFGGSE